MNSAHENEPLKITMRYRLRCADLRSQQHAMFRAAGTRLKHLSHSRERDLGKRAVKCHINIKEWEMSYAEGR